MCRRVESYWLGKDRMTHGEGETKLQQLEGPTEVDDAAIRECTW